MNCIRGTIENVRSHGNLTMVQIQLKSTSFKSIILESSDSLAFGVGSEIDVLFKETEVVIGSDSDHAISLRNRIHCNIKEIEKSELLSKLTLHSPEGTIRSVITTSAVDQLELKTGDRVWAMIKTNEIMLSM